jgi:hypothetical protein
MWDVKAFFMSSSMPPYFGGRVKYGIVFFALSILSMIMVSLLPHKSRETSLRGDRAQGCRARVGVGVGVFSTRR